MTTTGIHELLAAAPPPGAAATRTAATNTARAFPLRAEFGRQLRRRRTKLTLGLLALLPVVLVIAFLLGEDEESGSGAAALVELAKTGGVNFTLFAIYVSSTFLIVVVAALFAGDTVSSEASWSTLRYLLAAPVRRGRLLRQKWIVACVSIAVALLVLYGSALVAGTIAFGTEPVRSPTGAVFDVGTSLQRLGIGIGYIFVTSLLVAALAFLLGVWTDAPLGAVGGAVLIMIVSSILDQVEELGVVRQILPTHYQLAWTDALHPQVVWETMARGTAVSLAYSALLLACAWWHFLRKDIVS